MKLELRSLYFSVLIHLAFIAFFLIGVKVFEVGSAKETLIEIDLERFFQRDWITKHIEDKEVTLKTKKKSETFKVSGEVSPREITEQRAYEQKILAPYEESFVENTSKEERAKEENKERTGLVTGSLPREITGRLEGEGTKGELTKDTEQEKKLAERFLGQKLSLISEIIKKHLKYPYLARKMGWEGKVIVSFVLTKEGKVREVKVEKSSGYQVLDENTVATLYGCAKYFPVPPVDVKVKLPVVYKLD